MKKLYIPSRRKARVRLLDFSKGMNGSVDEKVSNVSIARLSRNFCMSNGALTDGVGVKEYISALGNYKVQPFLPIPLRPIKTYYYKRYDTIEERADDRLLVYAGDGYIYGFRLYGTVAEMVKIDGLKFDAPPSAVCYKYNGDDVVILSTENSFKIYDGESVLTVDSVPEITSMCIHGERLFVTTGGEQTSLWFSNDFDPTDWYVSLKQAGFIDFQDQRGRLLKAISFNNYVYVFRNYGISRIYAYGDQSDFSASGLFLCSGRIFKNAIVDCGNRIIYLAEDGFYSFDGLYSSRILEKYDKYLKNVDNSNAVGKFYNGKLYLALNMRLDGKQEKVLLVYDIAYGTDYLAKGFAVSDLEVVSANEHSCLIAVIDGCDKIGVVTDGARIFSSPLKKVWESQFCDFGIDGEKSLEKITLYTAKRLTLTVKSERGERRISLNGAPFKQTALIGLRGNTFSFKIESRDQGSSISKITLHFNYF